MPLNIFCFSILIPLPRFLCPEIIPSLKPIRRGSSLSQLYVRGQIVQKLSTKQAQVEPRVEKEGGAVAGCEDFPAFGPTHSFWKLS